MKELCIPLPGLENNEIAEVAVSLSGQKMVYNFRLESFAWEVGKEFSSLSDPLEKSLARIYKLKEAIESYDPEWELIQIFNPESSSDHVQVLYRKKVKQIQ